MTDSQKLISYFKDCYQADTKTLVINNLLDKKIEHLHFLEGKDELLNGNIFELPISEAYADEIERTLSIYKKEKAFYCSGLSIIGKLEEVSRKNNKVFAPLFLYPATIVRDEFGSCVSIDQNRRIININFLNTIKKEGNDDIHEAITENIPYRFEDDITTITIIKKVLGNRLHDFHCDEALVYPELLSEQVIKRKLQPKQLNKMDGFHLVSTSTLFVMNRSSSTQGVISELSELSQKTDYSAPLMNLFGNSKLQVEKLSKGWTPSILSESQKQIIDSVDSNVCTLVIGPPGTGKSYSIASLALEHMSKGKSVLIASKTDQAVNVVQKKIESDLGVNGVSFRAGKSEYKKQLKGYLDNLMLHNRSRPKENRTLEIANYKGVLQRIEREINSFLKEYDEMILQEMEWAEYLAKKEESPNWFAKLKFKYINWKNSKQQPHWTIAKNIADRLSVSSKLSKKYLEESFEERASHALSNNRVMYRNFINSLSARTSSRQEKLFKEIDLEQLLKTLPIWLVNLSDIHSVFPLEKELFDLAIIDEATQCDIACCLPIFQRAKRVVIVGDPRQLGHVSFLSQSMQYSLRKKYNIDESNLNLSLNYRTTSILDLLNDSLASQEQVCILDEHYRSKPDIIAFSNHNFYFDEMRVMTSIPNKDRSSHRFIVNTSGNRNSKGVNEIEAFRIIDDLKKLIEEQSHLSHEATQSIGILSPFRDQTDFLNQLLSTEIEISAIQKHDILCGTAYSFQGEERDIESSI